MLAYKRPPNIRDLLVRAKLPPERKRMMARRRKVGFRRCQKKNRCRLCPYTGLAPGEVVGEVKITHSGEVIPIKSLLDCQTENLLYILLCTKCLKQYLGETSKTAEERCVGHLNTILQQCHVNTKTPVGQHFRSGGHSHSDVKYIPFDLMSSTSHLKRSSSGTHHPFVRKVSERYLNNLKLYNDKKNNQLCRL